MSRRLHSLTALTMLSISLTLPLTACGVLARGTSSEAVTVDGQSLASMEDKLSFYSKIEAQHLSGSKGDTVHVQLDGGNALLVCDYPGSGWFAIKCYDEHGENLEPLLYKSGPYAGTTTSLCSSGTDLVIEGDGEWSVDVLPLSSMTKAGNEQTFHGDNVVYIDVDKVSEVSFSHDSDGAFSVKGIAVDTEGIQVPVTFEHPGGRTSFIEPWTYGQAVFVVEAEGDWTISWK